MNIGVHISFWVNIFIFFRRILRSGIARSYGGSIFNFWRNRHTIFHSGHHSAQGFPFFQHPCQHLLFVVFWCYLMLFDVLAGLRWYLFVVLICNSLMIINVELLFMCLLATYMSSLEKCLFRFSAHFLIHCLFSGCWVVWVLGIFWVLNPYWIYCKQMGEEISSPIQ